MHIPKATKHLIYSILALLTTGSLCSQDTLLYVDFQNNDLSPFVTVDNDMLPLDVSFQGLGGAFTVTPVNGPNDLRAVGVAAFEGGGTADNWLISPAIEVPAEGASISWTANSLSGEMSKLESYNIWVSTTDQNINSFTDFILEVVDVPSFQVTRELILDFYAGSTVYVALQQNGTDKFALAIDNFLVRRSPTGFSGELVSVRCPRYQDADNLSYEVEVSNNGMETLTELSLLLEMSNGTTEQLTLTNIELDPNDTDRYVFNQTLTGSNPTKMAFNIRVLTNDDTEVGFSPNHTLIPIIDPDERPIFIEEATSTICGWCPEGLTEKLFVRFVDPEAIIVSIHDQDPMENVVASLGLENTLGFAGYPSLAVNRLSSVLPGTVADYLNNEFSRVRVSPVVFDFSNTYDPTTRELNVEFDVTAQTNMDAEDYRFGLFVIEDFVRGTTPDFAQANNFSQDAFDVPLVGIDGFNWQLQDNPVSELMMIYNDVVRDVVGGYDGIIGSFETLNYLDQGSFEVDYVMPSVFEERNIRLVAYVVDVETGEVVAAKQDFLNFVSATNDLITDVKVDIYPNPSIDMVHLGAEGLGYEKYIIELYNMTHQVVLRKPVVSGNKGLDVDLSLNGILPGHYTLIIRHLDGVIARKISIVK